MKKGTLKAAAERKRFSRSNRAEVHRRLAQTPRPEPTKRLNADVPTDLHNAFKRRAVELDTSMSELLRHVLTVYLGR